MWEGTRAVKCLAMGATAVGLGRAALLAVDEDADNGLVRLVDCLALELRMIISALGKYTVDALDLEDVWFPGSDSGDIEVPVR
jgi:isopentenyl diphosphate isomerase/L-lactate dehydrogenase-like FMN-dependent dehydrogenase